MRDNAVKKIMLPLDIQFQLQFHSYEIKYDCLNTNEKPQTVSQTERENSYSHIYAIKLLLFDEKTTCLQTQMPHPF